MLQIESKHRVEPPQSSDVILSEQMTNCASAWIGFARLGNKRPCLNGRWDSRKVVIDRNLNPRGGNKCQSDADEADGVGDAGMNQDRRGQQVGKSERADGVKAHGLQGTGFTPGWNGDQRRMGVFDG